MSRLLVISPQFSFLTRKMWRILVLIACCVALAESNSAISPFIVGGNNATVGQFPYFVSIRYGTALTHGCGGGIINTRYVLTVRH